ncbi:sulfatase-like hydrolase/transferase [Cellvibrio japonicus]|uniref:Putative arylsulfatase n=1 Tax=Cellvibrio japonicus (strain Ueda107) TaxID=498211 RepID=B3PDX1_CELJU|nr:sulfatase-like hydrolase/transferase [Cellvibrio japonicus]ACE84607.1 putative arylsulfatase [Cellvibrio japonicus Ueda107]QEI13454.1 sulfatase-like hydrolase/transferase [Cellvibrio japonicus]QEI17028.1 sulfatase-like hydrolase/transferase [Cellvibrio japonicus]QEI20606.1 sulfatase-like hydrolase/transferase [Cellvibrio japonicus]
MDIRTLLLASLCLLAISGCHSGSSSGAGSSASAASASSASSHVESSSTGSSEPASPPNILFVIMDDVGVDQMPSMGYGGLHPPSMPTIDAIAGAGIRFRNTWSMPECSPGRAALLAGRYPLRTNIYQAIGPNDLANSQLSRYDLTAPKLLKGAGYESAMFGKFHLAGPDYNAAGNGTPRELGWDYFYGWTGGLPASIDTTAGGIAPADTYSCGYVPALADDGEAGADQGACYIPHSPDNFTCAELTSDPEGDAAGLQCLIRGGILVPNAACAPTPPDTLDFARENAHYVSPLVINRPDGIEEVPLADPRGRGYRSTIEAAAARDWINSRDGSKPWMATVSFSAAHTPLQTPPSALLPSNNTQGMKADCRMATDTLVNQRLLTDALVEAMDEELGRLLVETGIAVRDGEGRLAYQPDSNTMVVIVGDNGSFGATAKVPFDLTRAKGTAYQTGIWVPLIVAGPLVGAPDRDVEHMVNTADVFHLFGEIAGLAVDTLAPQGIDGMAMLPYLQNPVQSSLRAYNFAQGGLNIQLDQGRNGPCVINNLCSHTPVNKAVCEDNGGTWWGMGADDPQVAAYGSGDLAHCWQVNQAIYRHDPDAYAQNRREMGWTSYLAIRNDHYKLVRNRTQDYDTATDNGVEVESVEFYAIDQAVPLPTLDTADNNLLADKAADDLPLHQRQHYQALSARLDAILASQPACPGDGNRDGMVDGTDLEQWAYWADPDQGGGYSSWYDFNYDGLTDAADRAVIEANRGNQCQPQP